MNRSLRQRLTIIVGALSLTVWLAIGVLQWQQLQQEVDALFDAHIAEAAQTLFGLARHELYEHAVQNQTSQILAKSVFSELESAVDSDYAHDHVYQVIIDATQVMLRSPGAPATPLVQRGLVGLRDTKFDGKRWRIFSLQSAWSQGLLGVVVAEPYTARRMVMRHLMVELSAPLALALPLLVAAIWAGLRWGLQPLHRVVGEVERRNAANLEPLAVGGVPVEVAPVIASLNLLLKRLQRALDGERRFTADAAHELRTPLAGIRAQVQLAQRAPVATARAHAMTQAIAGVDRASHLVTQLLTLARLDPEISDRVGVRVALAPVVADEIAALRTAATTPVIAVENGVGADAVVDGNADALGLAVRNLLDNALRYTPAGGRVRIMCDNAPGGAATLIFDDSGPGIAADQQVEVLRRFYRLAGTNVSGSGLGLSIVARVAALHEAKLTLADSPLGGLRVSLVFPPLRPLPAR